MGKDYKHKSIAKAKKKIISWDELPSGAKGLIDRENFDLGEYRKEKKKKQEKYVKKQLNNFINGKEEEN